MGARLRLRATTDLSAYPASVQKIFRAMKRYGLIVADNGTDMYVSGTMDPHWDNDVLNPAFHSLHADDFEVVQLGWGQPTTGIP
jgi:DNA-binding transcriptional regulator YhcF (GntR family)